MKPVTSVVDIDLPADRVFNFLDEVENNPRWLEGMKSCRWVTEPPVGVGSIYEQVAEFLGKKIVTTFEVVEHRPGNLVKIASRAGSSFPLEVTRKVDPLGEGSCRVTEIVDSDPQGFYRIAVPLLRLMVQRRIRRDYRRLKTLLEKTDCQVGSGSN